VIVADWPDEFRNKLRIFVRRQETDRAVPMRSVMSGCFDLVQSRPGGTLESAFRRVADIWDKGEVLAPKAPYHNSVQAGIAIVATALLLHAYQRQAQSPIKPGVLMTCLFASSCLYLGHSGLPDRLVAPLHNEARAITAMNQILDQTMGPKATADWRQTLGSIMALTDRVSGSSVLLNTMSLRENGLDGCPLTGLPALFSYAASRKPRDAVWSMAAIVRDARHIYPAGVDGDMLDEASQRLLAEYKTAGIEIDPTTKQSQIDFLASVGRFASPIGVFMGGPQLKLILASHQRAVFEAANQAAQGQKKSLHIA